MEKEKKKKLILISGIALLIIGGSIYFYKVFKANGVKDLGLLNEQFKQIPSGEYRPVKIKGGIRFESTSDPSHFVDVSGLKMKNPVSAKDAANLRIRPGQSIKFLVKEELGLLRRAFGDDIKTIKGVIGLTGI